ncbi:MAG TPA: DNA-binding protein, partial [Myxococcaceae bacterium]|nr:DNA-binding protein [Myxococcaceae bacterium]
MPEDLPARPSGAGERTPSDRLDSWKEIAAYLRRDVTTVQRWEKRESMPVHRHQHDRAGSVYAFRAELDAWARSRRSTLDVEEARVGQPPDRGGADAERATPATSRRLRGGRRIAWLGGAGLGIPLLAAATVWWVHARWGASDGALAGARFEQLTNFEGVEQAAALSRDGQFVAFQSDHDGPMDVWLTQVGTGRFSNLTRGTAPEIVNPSVRTLGFSPDGSLVTFWARGRPGSTEPEIGIW